MRQRVLNHLLFFPPEPSRTRARSLISRSRSWLRQPTASAGKAGGRPRRPSGAATSFYVTATAATSATASGGAVALALALERPPAGLILQSAFTSVRDMARLHYPYLPRELVPDAYPSIALVRDLRAPLMILHGERYDIVPASHAKALYDPAPAPKRIHVFPRIGHNDLVSVAAEQWVEAIAGFAEELTPTSRCA